MGKRKATTMTKSTKPKGRPRTRSQIKPNDDIISSPQSTTSKKSSNNTKLAKSNNKIKKTKSSTSSSLSSVMETITDVINSGTIITNKTGASKAKVKLEKIKTEPPNSKNVPKKNIKEKITKERVTRSKKDADSKSKTTATKKVRKGKTKQSSQDENEQNFEMYQSEPILESMVIRDDHHTEDEHHHRHQHIPDIHSPTIMGDSNPMVPINRPSLFDTIGPISPVNQPVLVRDDSSIAPPSSQLDSMTTTLVSSKISSPYQFESSMEKLQHETMAPKPFNVNNQESSYMPSLYPSITSSSISAFNPVPSQSKTYPMNIGPTPHNPNNHLHHHNQQHHLPPPTVQGSVPVSHSPVGMVHHQPIITPNHQNLLSPTPTATPSSSSTNASDPVHDLPSELLQQGWRKFWSRREGRNYYFNKVTNESLWELPKLSGQFDPLTDPLGIQSSNSSAFSQLTPTDPGTPPIYPILVPPLKNIDQVVNGKKVLLGPFDHSIESNCYIWEGFVLYCFHSHPETELLRSNLISKLRKQFYELCQTREGIEAPKDSFTRWIMERKVTDKGFDPFLPSDCPSELSKTLFNEIMNDIPIKLVQPKFSGEARKQLSKYAEAAKKIIDSPHVSAMSRKIVKWNVEDAFEWIRKTLNATYDDYIERLEHLKKQCQPHIVDAARSSVESICLKIYHVSVEYSKRIRELNLELLKKDELRERPPTRFANQKKVICYPAYLINPCPKLPSVQIFSEKDSSILRYKNGEFLRINTSYMQKLELLYYYNCRDDRKCSFFITRIWCMLKRYQTFFNKPEGLFSQNSLPLSVFAVLNKHFGVTFECFASPLNSYFRQYCSIFPDTDGYFGSRGSILNFYPMSGSFQANPPDCQELVEATIIHFEKMLENSIEPLSFILFLQEVPDNTQNIISRLESCKYKRTHLTIMSQEHEYRHGFQYQCNPADVYNKSQYNTLIYFLQNDAGFLKWGPTPERVDELVESFKIGRDKELPILSPQPMNNQQKPIETELNPNGQEGIKDLA